MGTEDLAARVLHNKGEAVLMVAGYMRHGLGIKGANVARLQKLAAVLGAWVGSWVAYLDWNFPPEDLARFGWLGRLRGSLFAPKDTAFTCTAGKMRMLDYVVRSEDLRG